MESFRWNKAQDTVWITVAVEAGAMCNVSERIFTNGRILEWHESGR